MASSYFYAREMERIGTKIGNLELKKTSYSNYIEKIEALIENFAVVLGGMSGTADILANGGYISDGRIIDSDNMTTEQQTVSDNIETLQTVLNGTTNQIADIQEDIDKLQKEYEEAKRNYKRAKKKEEEQ